MIERWPFVDPDKCDECEEDSGAPTLQVEVTDPEVLGVILDARGEPAWTLLGRRPIAFGFQPTEGA